jgi:hypothetical protein
LPLYSAEVERLFLALVDADEPTRQRRLDSLPPPLRQQVARLLELDAVADDVLPPSGPLVLADQHPESVAHFRIDGTLGRGSFGVVYTAHQQDPERTVALKVFHGRVTEASADRFRREARALASVRHPAIPRVYEAGTDNGRHWISMDLIEGEPVADWLATRPDQNARFEVVATVADALVAAHTAGVLHRDIKPSNLVIGADGAHLLDFGIAATSTHHERAGTPAFMSPEAMAGTPLDGRSDLYSLARLAEQLLETDGDLVPLLQRALASNPADRHATVAEFADDLQRVREDRPLPWAATPQRRATLWAKRNRTLLAFSGMLGCVLLAWAFASTLVTARQHEQTQTRYTAVQGAVRTALEAHDHASAQEAMDGFLHVPANDALAPRALLWWGELQQAQGLDGREALVQAWLRSSDRPGVSRALAHAMKATSNWTGLWGLRAELEHDPELQPLIVQAAEARRDFSLSNSTFATQAARATDLGKAPWRAVRLGPDLIQHHRTRLVMPGNVDVPAPHPEAWTQSDNFARVGDAIWMATGDGQTPTAVHRWTGERWETLAALPAGGVAAVAASDTGLFVAITYPGRGLWHVDNAGVVTVPHPPTNAIDSDVMDVRYTDLTGDGQDDLLLVLGAWHGYALRVMVRDDDVGWRLLSETPQGVVQDTALLQGAPPILLAGKVDVEIDGRTFGLESPLGPEAGMYAYTADPNGLQHRAFWPLPIPDDPDTSYVKIVENPLVGDFDGDGTQDVAWTLSRMSSELEGHLWILFDVRGALERGEHPTSRVIWGLVGHAAHDADGDGDDELLVTDDTNGQLYEWGTGDDALPVHDRSLAPAPAVPDGASAAVQEIWGRAAELTRLGLPARASRQLALTPIIAAEPAIQRQALVWAAGISRQTGDLEAARDQLRAALALHDDPVLRADLTQVLLDLLDLPAARAVHPQPPAWMDAPDRVMASRDLAGWSLEHVGVLAPGASLRVMNDHGVVARRPVEVVGSWVQLDLEAVIRSLELGAGVAVELVRGEDTLLSVGFWGQGGGGSTKVYRTCGTSIDQHLGVELLDPDGPHALTLSVARPHQGGLHCRGTRDHRYPGPPITPGPAELILRAHGDPLYNPPAAVELELTVRAVGLLPSSTPPTPHAAARRALASGVASGQPTPGEEAWWARARGESLDTLLDPDADRRTLRWLLRTEDPDVLQVMYGRPDFPSLFEEAFMPLLEEAHGRRLALLPPLTALPVSAPAARRVLAVRAQALIDRGDFAAARLIASRVASWDAVEQPVSHAALLLAQLDPESRWDHLERAVLTSPAPDQLVRAALHRPGLEDLDLVRLQALTSR